MIPSPELSLWPIAPEILLLAEALALLGLGLFLRERRRSVLAWLSLAGVLAAGVLVCHLWAERTGSAVHEMLVADGYGALLKLAILAGAALSVLFSVEYVRRNGIPQVEYYALVLVATSGMLLMVAATNLVTVFLSLEILSIALYVLVGLNRGEQRSSAASLRYLLLGALASAFLLYGTALVYGQAGTTSLQGIRDLLGSQDGRQPLLLVGLGLIVVGLGFKVALVPFHLWTPDVYAGAPTSVTAFMSLGTKAAGFGALGRVLLYGFGATLGDWQWLFAQMAALTMTAGNLAALRETNLKRLLAYSGIAQAGTILVGFAAANELGVSGALFYLLAYAFANVAAFGVVIAVARWSGVDLRGETLDAYADLAGRRPWLALAMSLSLLSLAGFPPLAGFMSKLYVFSAAVRGGLTWLAVVGVVNSAIAAAYYLRLIAVMVGRRQERGGGLAQAGTVCPAVQVGLALACLVTLLLGVWPGPVLEWARAAAAALLSG